MTKLKNELGPTEPEQIIAFLLTDHTEPYPFAKLVAFLTLCTWMRWPDDQELIEDAQITAAASIYIHEKEKGNAPAIPLTVERLAHTVAFRQLVGSYQDAFYERGLIGDLIFFFMMCPEDLRPSLGKAYHFIDSGGFIPEDATEEEIASLRRARSSLKIAWKEQAVAGPLLFTSNAFGDDDDAIDDFAPDAPEYFDEAQQLVLNRDRMLQFFGEALHCQEKLQRLLDPDAAAKLLFPKFPSVVTPVDPGFGAFHETQVEIIKKYRAPQ
jgi:hypothetical protein